MLADLRYALRLLLKTPAFTLIAVLTLSVGIGSAAVVFSTVNGLLLRPLPFIQNADRLLWFTQTGLERGLDDLGVNYEDATDFARESTTLEGIILHTDRTVIMEGAEMPERIFGTEITATAFDLLGVQPALGRNFRPEEEDKDQPQVALLSHGLWQQRFGGAPDVLGTKVTINGEVAEIIGVMPAGWRYPEITDLWTPLRLHGLKEGGRGNYYLAGRAVMKPGVTPAQVQAEADTIMRAVAAAYPETNAGIGLRFEPLREKATHDSAHLTLILFGAVMAVFLIACANVAGLLLSRAASRSKELGIRLALGAGRGRLVRQLLTESLLLGAAGAVGGLILTLWGVDLVVAALPVESPFWLRFEPDWLVCTFVAGLAFLAVLLFGLVPAWKATSPDVATSLKEGGRTCDDCGPRTNRIRHALVVAEVAVSLVLLVGAGLMMRSFLELRRVDPGFRAEGVLTFRTGFPPGMVGDDKHVAARFFEALVTRLEALPGVESAAAVGVLPGVDGNATTIHLEGTPEPAGLREAPLVRTRAATAGFLRVSHIPLLAGRWIEPQDRAGAPLVAVVDEAFARQHLGGVDEALGRRFRYFGQKDKREWLEIVGVVGSTRHRLDRDETHPTFYTPHTQDEANFMSVMMRTRGEPASYLEAARAEVLAVNPIIPIYHPLTHEDVVLRSVWPRRFFSWLFTVFGAIALFLACIGLYGVMAYSVTQRGPEIGVRMALGAPPAGVIGLIVRHGLRLVAYGLGAGFAAALLLARLLESQLYGVSPHDPPTFAVVPLLLAAVALLACYLPSRRATRIDPALAIRGS